MILKSYISVDKNASNFDFVLFENFISKGPILILISDTS